MRLTYKLCLQDRVMGLKVTKKADRVPLSGTILFTAWNRIPSAPALKHGFLPVTQSKVYFRFRPSQTSAEPIEFYYGQYISLPEASGHSHFQHKAAWATLSSFYGLFPDIR